MISARGGVCSRHISSSCGSCNLNPFRVNVRVLIGGLLLASTCCCSNTFVVHAVREASFSCPNPDAVADDGTCLPSSESPPANGNSAGTAAAQHDIYHHNNFQRRHQQSAAAAGRQPLPVDDESTLLDLFGDVAKELLTKHVIPPTDAQCRWDWRHARCEPHCDCAFVPLWGDYHLGRSCRLRYEYFDGRETCHLPPDTPYVKVFGGAANVARVAAARTVRIARDVSNRADIKRRLVGIRNRACRGWKDRADVTGNEMNRVQKRLCRNSDGGSWRRSNGRYDGYDNMYDEDDEQRVDVLVEDEGREEREAELLAAKIANVRVDVEERTSLQHKKQQQRQQEQQQEKRKQKEKHEEAEHDFSEGEARLGDRSKELHPEAVEGVMHEKGAMHADISHDASKMEDEAT